MLGNCFLSSGFIFKPSHQSTAAGRLLFYLMDNRSAATQVFDFVLSPVYRKDKVNVYQQLNVSQCLVFRLCERQCCFTNSPRVFIRTVSIVFCLKMPLSEQIKQLTAHKHYVFTANFLMHIALFWIMTHNVLLNISYIAKCFFGVWFVHI